MYLKIFGSYIFKNKNEREPKIKYILIIYFFLSVGMNISRPRINNKSLIYLVLQIHTSSLQRLLHKLSF